MAAPILQFKRGVIDNLPGLRAGEPALTTDTFDLYVGIDSTTNNNKFFGSHRYWTRQTATTGSGIRFLERTDGGSNYIELKAPDTALAGNVTYALPGSQGASSSVLTNDGSGNLSWSSGSANPAFSGIVTFTDTTDNTLGNADTGAVQIDGGLGVNKNVSIGGSLFVGGYAEFVGVVTFRGGTINLGDGNTDNINVGGEFVSGLAPDVDNTYDIGISTQRWRDAYFSGIGSFATGAYIDAVQIGITGTNIIDTTTGGLTLNSASGQTTIDDNLSVTGIATITGAFIANGDVTLGDTSGDTITINGTTTFNQPLVGTIGTATRAITVDITDTDAQSGGIVFGSVGTGSTLYNDTDLTYNSNTNILSVPVVSATTEVRTGSVKAADGTTAITITNSTGAVATNGALTVGGDLFVNGSTTQVNTTTLNVKDALIDLGLIDTGGGVLGVPTSDLNKDIGLLLNYFSTTAKKAAMFWDDSSNRIVFADDATESTGTLTVTNGNYASIEIESLWVNDCAGQSQVISCTGTERFLENITVDAGQF
jgi:hypothetical protein